MARVVPAVRGSEAARDALRRLARTTGDLVIVQSDGRRGDGATRVLPAGDFRITGTDVRMGAVAGVPVYCAPREPNAWTHGDLELDVEPGYADGLSLEPAPGQHFVARWRAGTPAGNAVRRG